MNSGNTLTASPRFARAISNMTTEHGPEPYDADPGESVRSWFELSEDSLSGEPWADFCAAVRSDGWLINRTRKRADGMTNVYIKRPGHRGF